MKTPVPRIALATLCLNEQEWLDKLYAQHIDWPGMEAWVFVESADRQYAAANPHRVTKDGLSVDRTPAIISGFSDPRITYIRHGFCSAEDPAQGKCEARTVYLDALKDTRLDYLIVLDADEFYPHAVQDAISRMLGEQMRDGRPYDCVLFRQRHMWRPDCIRWRTSPVQYEVTGGFWSIPHCRVWKWYDGLKYAKNHNTPQLPDGRLLDQDVPGSKQRAMLRIDSLRTGELGTIECVHTGFASNGTDRLAKNRYYAQRGEAADPVRAKYVESRDAFRTWVPGRRLPGGAKVVRYDGAVPECFLAALEADAERKKGATR